MPTWPGTQIKTISFPSLVKFVCNSRIWPGRTEPNWIREVRSGTYRPSTSDLGKFGTIWSGPSLVEQNQIEYGKLDMIWPIPAACWTYLHAIPKMLLNWIWQVIYIKVRDCSPPHKSYPPLLEWRATLVFVCMPVCTGVETDLHTIPSHPVLGKPQGFSPGMLMNKQPTSIAASHSILTSLYPPTSTKMMTKAAAVAQKARIMHALWIWIQKAQLMEKH